MVVVDTTVDNLPDLIDKQHHFLLQHLSRVRKMPDVAETDDCIHLLPRDHGIDASACAATHVDVVSDDFRTSLTKAQSQQATEFDDCLLEDHRLHRLLCSSLFESGTTLPQLASLGHLLLPLTILDLLSPVLQVSKSHGLQRIVLNGLHLGDHALDGLQQQLIGIIGKRHGSDAHGTADEDCLQHAESSLELCYASTVKRKQNLNVMLLSVCPCGWHKVFHFRTSQILIKRARGWNVHRDYRHTSKVKAALNPRLRQSLFHRI
mmetsp:Transcript_117421/g.219572  ORF Transcript_117421/g.219572 Transcript_117421/m.219572 type:complete len:263 (+) Transcript_117421:256-1044(+)